MSILSIKLGELVAKESNEINDSDIFLVDNLDSSSSNKITFDELSKSFVSIQARPSNSLSLKSNDGTNGLTVYNAGYVGIYDSTPQVSLDVLDNLNAPNTSGQIRLSTLNSGRKISFTLQDPNVNYQISKKANDEKLFFQYADDAASSYRDLLSLTKEGSLNLTTGTPENGYKVYISGGQLKLKDTYGLILDPASAEIKTESVDQTMLINWNTVADVVLGRNAVYVDNHATDPKVGIGISAPQNRLHVSGNGLVARFSTNGNTTAIALNNQTRTSFVSLNSNNVVVGSSAIAEDSNIVYNLNSRYLGVGIGVPTHKLSIVSSDESVASFANTTGNQKMEIIVSNNRSISGPGETGPRYSLVTFARNASGSLPFTKKWAVGNYYTGISGSDIFVIIKDGNETIADNTKLTLDTNGNLSVKGSYFTDSSYCKGSFVEIYKTRIKGTGDIYVDPLGDGGSSYRSSGNFYDESPFSVMPYAGNVRRLMLMTSDDLADGGSLYYAEVYATNGASTDSDGFTNIEATGGTIPPTIAGNTKARSTFSLNKNQPSVITTFVGAASFTSGQLLQYRFYKDNGDPINMPVTISSAISFTIV